MHSVTVLVRKPSLVTAVAEQREHGAVQALLGCPVHQRGAPVALLVPCSSARLRDLLPGIRGGQGAKLVLPNDAPFSLTTP